MSVEVINLTKKMKLFDEYWAPRIIAQMNDYHFKLVKIQGQFIWHSHPETDEVFIVIRGDMKIAFRDESVNLSAGEICVVPKGIEHKPIADKECQILLIEPVGTLNTGDTGGELTITEEIWI